VDPITSWVACRELAVRVSTLTRLIFVTSIAMLEALRYRVDCNAVITPEPIVKVEATKALSV
jgi:hypothetical protein